MHMTSIENDGGTQNKLPERSMCVNDGQSGCTYVEGRRFQSLAHPSRAGTGSAFSLIELLVVIAIIGLLAGATVPVFRGIMGAGRVPSAAGQIASMLEFARNEAMTRQTYVWVAFDNVKNDSDNYEIRMAAFASDDGSTAGTPRQLSRMVNLPEVALIPFNSLKSDTKSLFPSGDGAPVSVAESSESLRFLVKGQPLKRVVTFTPRGEALLAIDPQPETTFDRTLDVSVRFLRAGKSPSDVDSSPDDATVVTSGSSGRVDVLYLR